MMKVYSQDRLVYATGTNNPNISVALNNKDLFFAHIIYPSWAGVGRSCPPFHPYSESQATRDSSIWNIAGWLGKGKRRYRIVLQHWNILQHNNSIHMLLVRESHLVIHNFRGTRRCNPPECPEVEWNQKSMKILVSSTEPTHCLRRPLGKESLPLARSLS